MIRSKTLACSWRGKREQERRTIRPAAGLFLEHCTTTLTTLPSSSTSQVPSTLRLHPSPPCGGLHGQGIGNNNTVIPLHNTAETRRNNYFRERLKIKKGDQPRWRQKRCAGGGNVPQTSRLERRSAEHSIYRPHQRQRYKNSLALTLTRSVSHA